MCTAGSARQIVSAGSVRLNDAVYGLLAHAGSGHPLDTHIGDFRKWKDHDWFQKSLDRLLRDLKSQTSRSQQI
jgi:hypothetical protein